MKVAFICPDGYSILLFCKGIIAALLNARGVDSVVVISADGKYKKDIEQLGVKSISLDMYRYVNPFHDLKYVVALFRILRRERCEIVFNMSTKPNIYGTIAARLAGVRRVVCHVVGLGNAFLPDRSIKGALTRAGATAFYRLAFLLSSKVWFTNAHDASFFAERGLIDPMKIVLTKNYLDASSYAPAGVGEEEIGALRKELGVSERERVVAMVSRMIWPKGVREFVEAAGLLREKLPETRFLLVGPLETGNPHAVPEAYLREWEKKANVKWLGFREDVKSVYALADLAVYPSYYKEGGYPRGLLEPMAMGKPIIATNTIDCRGPVEEGKNGYLVPPQDPKALADAIKRVMADELLRRQLGRYSHEKMAREFDETKIIPETIARLGIGDPAPARSTEEDPSWNYGIKKTRGNRVS